MPIPVLRASDVTIPRRRRSVFMNYLLILFTLCSGLVFAQKDTLHLFFEVDDDQLKASQIEELERLNTAADLAILEIHAYCDSSASNTYNDELSKRRLHAVSSQFPNLPNKIRMAAHGEQNAKSRDMAHDRRVDVIYLHLPPPMPVQVEREQVVQEDAPLPSGIEEFLQGEEGEVIIQLSILFYNRSGQYLPESEPELKALYKFMNENPNVSAHIRGHICCNPFTDWDDISEKRAATVASYLIFRGIDESRITHKGYGTSIPFRDPEITEEDKKLNRRVDVVFTKH